MKTPSNCPICQKPLLNEEKLSTGFPCWEKKCMGNHYLVMTTKPGYDDQLAFLSLQLSPKCFVNWNFFVPGICWLSDAPIKIQASRKKVRIERLPFFEPDFSDYKKLLNKIKTLILFS